MTLTEQLYEGTLPNGNYYVELQDKSTTPVYMYKMRSRKNKVIYRVKAFTGFITKNQMKSVLEELPSYEEWQAKLEENAQLKELLKECELWFTGVVGNMNDKNVGEHNRNLPIGNFEHVFKVFSQKINQA